MVKQTYKGPELCNIEETYDREEVPMAPIKIRNLGRERRNYGKGSGGGQIYLLNPVFQTVLAT